MSNFTQAEISYLQSPQLGRLATVGSDGQPHVVPVGYRYNAAEDAIDIGGRGFATSKNFATRSTILASRSSSTKSSPSIHGVFAESKYEVLPKCSRLAAKSAAPPSTTQWSASDPGGS
jgi:hypothetical protein